MSCITYTAKAGCLRVPGHTAGVSYIFDLRMQNLDITRRPFIESQTTLSGRQAALKFYRELFYDALTIPMRGTLLLTVEEFLQSCEAKEQFTWDAYGTAAVPVEPVAANLDTLGASFSRVVRVGQGGGNDWFTTTFRVRVVQ